MGLFGPKKEERSGSGTVQYDDGLLQALLGTAAVTKATALQVPTVSGGIGLIASVVAGTPVKLYRDEGGRASEVGDDPRVRLLNDETGDTLNANEFWHAMVRDYYLGKGGYAYIHKERGCFKSLHYVDEAQIAIQKNTDPIFKDFDILVQGRRYRPFEFLKVLRHTRDGAQGIPITVESAKLIEVAYQSLCFESYLVKKGGNKKGFLKSKSKITDEAMLTLKRSFAGLYSNDSDNVVVLNNGIEFQESSATSTEMQLNENKMSNAEEFSKIFHVSTAAMSGKASESDISGLARLAAIPLMSAIQCALNYDPKTNQIYTPNTNKTSVMGAAPEEEMSDKAESEAAEAAEKGLPPAPPDDILEPRANPYHDPKTGRFAPGRGGSGGGKKSGKTKYAPSPQRNKSGVQMKPKAYAKLCGEFKTRYPELKPEDGPRWVSRGKNSYKASADGFGGLIVHKKAKIK